MRTIYNFQFTIFNKFSINKKGFTLIELLIVLAIIGVLSALLMANFIGVRQRARDAQRKSNLRQIQAALEIYRSDQGVYPSSLLTCGSALSGGSPAVTYMQKIPCDPLNAAPYLYSYSLSGDVYTLIACLENVNDSQKDSSNRPPCDGTNNWSFTINTP